MTRQTRKLGHGQWKGLLWTLVAIMVATRIREDQIAIPQFLQSSSTVRHAQWTMNANIQNNTTTPTIQYPSSRPLPTQQSLPPSHSINKQPLEKDTHGNCWRYCHHRNHLVYYRYQNFAGLADRMSVLNSLASLAGYLCARFEWSSPSQMLAKRHNHNQPIAESTEWNDFFDARWLQDGTPLWSTNTTTSSITNIGRSDQNHTIYSLQNWTLILECKTRSESLSQLEQIEAFSLQHTDGTSSFLWIIDFNLYDMRGSMVSRLRGKAINQTTMSIPTTTTTIRTANITSTMAHSTNSTFPIADQTNRNNSIPRTTTDQADDNERMLPSLITMPVRWGCTYHELTIPSHTIPLVDEIWRTVLQQHQQRRASLPNATTTATTTATANTTTPRVGILHIRRGDTIKVCNTSLSRMASFLRCSFEGSDVLGPIVLLFSSDEQDPKYRQGIQRIIEEDDDDDGDATVSSNVFRHVTFVDFDQLVQRQIQRLIQQGRLPIRLLPVTTNNNFYIWKVQDWIRQTKPIAFTLEQRRTWSCRDCDTIIDSVVVAPSL